MALTINGTTGIETNTDTGKVKVGTDDDLEIYHDGTHSHITNSTGWLKITESSSGGGIQYAANNHQWNNQANDEAILYGYENGAVEIYYNGLKTFETLEYGAQIKRTTGGSTSLDIVGCEGQDAQLYLAADDGDDNNDKMRLIAGQGSYSLQNYGSGSWETNASFHADAQVELYYNNTKRFATIDDGARVFGRLGIGNDTSGWAENLNVSTDQANGYGIAIRHDHDNAGSLMRFATSDGLCGSVNGSGTSTSFNTSSDYRLKENEVTLSNGITRIKQLKPYRFNFKCNESKTVDGFFAHEVTPVVPEAITGTKDEVDSDNKPVYQGIDQSKLVPLLTAALQEAITKIETLETEVNTLKTKVAALEAA